MALQSSSLKPDQKLVDQFGPQIASALQALSLIPMGGVDMEAPELLNSALGGFNVRKGFLKLLKDWTGKGETEKAAKDAPILLKPKDIVYKSAAEMAAHAKPGAKALKPNVSNYLGKETTMNQAINILASRYPHLASKLVKEWKPQFLPKGVMAQTIKFSEKDIPSIWTSTLLPLQAMEEYGLSPSGPELFIPTLEHELTHAVQEFLAKKGLRKTFNIEGKGLGDILLEPQAYLRGGKRAADFGGKDIGIPESVAELIRQARLNK